MGVKPNSLIPPEEREDLPEKEFPSNEPQKIDDSNFPEAPTEEEEEEKPSKPQKRDVEEEEDEETPRIPKRRFDRVYAEREEWKRRSEESDRRIDKLSELLEKSLTSSQQRQIERATPDKWKKILGEDNPLTDQFYALLNEELESRTQRARDEALQQWEERQQQSQLEVTERLQSLTEENEAFADEIGIDPSTKEGDQMLADILEIQDELTPTGPDGKYTQPLIPIDVAYEVYQARNHSAQNAQRANRSQASTIVASGRGGNIEVARNTDKGRPNPSAWRKFFDK